MAQEDDLRALGKVMDFMRGISVIFLLVNCYWFCYEAFHVWGVTLGIIDKILMNFQRTTGSFSSILWTKLFCVLFLALSCLGTKGVKEEKITWAKIWTILFSGFVFFFLNWWLLVLPIGKVGVASLYIFTLSIGYICLLMGGVWMSRLLKNNLMDDVFNTENESFMQETRLMENEYSVNLPTRFYYKKKWNNGWINVVNPFRAHSGPDDVRVLGFRQHIAGFTNRTENVIAWVCQALRACKAGVHTDLPGHRVD